MLLGGGKDACEDEDGEMRSEVRKGHPNWAPSSSPSNLISNSHLWCYQANVGEM